MSNGNSNGKTSGLNNGNDKPCGNSDGKTSGDSGDEYISYRQAGVDIDANDIMIDRIRRSVLSTHGPRVIDLHDGFAGFFRLDYDEKLFKKNYRHPVLVACTDGVGTKVLVARAMGRFDTVGIDLVAMNVNDMIVHGAEPLLFLDYLGVNRLDPQQIAEMVEGVANGCRQANCALIGGETAEMPDIYRNRDEFDMAGFAVGVAEKNRIITGKNIRKGDIILGLASSGLHSNGFALARHICFKQLKLKVTDKIDLLDGSTLGDVLLEPTKIYVRAVIGVLSTYTVKKVIHGMAHITGGGIVGNVPRILPSDCNAVIRKSAWQVPKIFEFLRNSGPVTEEEMFRVFNMGIGYVMIVAPDFTDSVEHKLKIFGQTVYRLGSIAAGTGKIVFK